MGFLWSAPGTIGSLASADMEIHASILVGLRAQFLPRIALIFSR